MYKRSFVTALVATIADVIIIIYYYYVGDVDSALWWFYLYNYIAVTVVAVGTIIMFWKFREILKLIKENNK